jgi:hypothetical protein
LILARWRVSAEAACEILHKALPRKRYGPGPSKLPAGGSWGPPALLSAPGDSVSNFLGGRVVADSAGTFVIAWTDGTTRTLNVLTSPPGGGFGPAVTLAPNVGQINNLQIAPGHAVLTFNSVVTNEPVS